MNVELIGWTENADEIAQQAAGICWMSDNPAKSLQVAMSYGHTSVLEHNSFTWKIEGISSAALAQMTRHRIGCSYSVQSFRHTAPGEENTEGLPLMIVPGAIAGNAQHNAQFRGAAKTAIMAYQNLIHAGVSKEDARLILPMGVTRNMIVSMNARALLHFVRLRITPHAEAEIRHIATLMYQTASAKAPIILPPLATSTN